MKEAVLGLYRKLLRACARRLIRRTRPYVIGLTGSVGKTTARLIVTQTIEQLLPDLRVLTSPKNFNGELGFALSVLGIESFTPSVWGYLRGLWQAVRAMWWGSASDVMVLEYGIDHVGEMDEMLSVVCPDVGIITRIDAVHSEQMGDPTQIAEQKRKMIDAAKDVVFLNQDDEYIQQMADRTEADVLWYSVQDGASGDVGCLAFEMTEDEVSLLGSDVTLQLGDVQWSGRVSLVSKPFLAYTAIGMSITSMLGYRRELNVQERERLDYTLQPGRLGFFEGVEQTLIIDSSYNSSPASLEAMLGIAYRLKHDVYDDTCPLIGIIGDMRELGDLSEQSHRQAAGVLSQGLDMIILVGKEVQYTIDELQKIGYPKEQVKYFVSSREAGEWVKQAVTGIKSNKQQVDRSRAMIFVKGSQNTIYTEEAIKQLLVNPADISHLGRQADRWMAKKEKFFASVES